MNIPEFIQLYVVANYIARVPLLVLAQTHNEFHLQSNSETFNL